jgi:Uma2 family endonuclease
MATVTTRIGPTDNGRSMTIEEFLEAEEEPGYRYELARGVLEVTEVPNDPHNQVVCNLYDVASYYRRTHPGVILRYGGGDEFRLWMPGMVSGRNPDLGLVVRGAIKDRRGRFKPSLVVEVVSKGSVDRDHRAKRDEYLAYGLDEYWIIDFLTRKMTLLVRDGDIWVERPCVDDQPIPSLVLPGLTSTPAELWIDLDAYEDSDYEDE